MANPAADTPPGRVCALFLAAPAPGQVFRFLERRFGRTPEHRSALNALSLLLSDAAPRSGLRVLTGGGHGLRAFLEGRGALFAAAFAAGAESASAAVTLLYADDSGAAGRGEWGWSTWTGDRPDAPAGAESFSEGVARSGPGAGARLLAGLTGGVATGDGAAVRARTWGRKRGLPVERVPGLAPAALRVPVVDYATVAALDQKGLLLEDAPRLYRLTF